MSERKGNINAARYMGLATQWFVVLLIAVWAGYKADKVLGWSVPLFLILLPLISLAFSLWRLVKELNGQRK